jgi:hypothetical protein
VLAYDTTGRESPGVYVPRKKSLIESSLAALLATGLSTASAATMYLVDFEDAKADPTDANWNTGITVAGSAL